MKLPKQVVLVGGIATETPVLKQQRRQRIQEFDCLGARLGVDLALFIAFEKA